MLAEIFTALEETLFMVFSAGLFTWCIGLPLGILLGEKKASSSSFIQHLHKGLTLLLNVVNTVPYLILMLALIPITQKLLGLESGSIAAIIPMTIAAIPSFAKSTETALANVPKGIIDLAISIGASRWQIIYKILIPEALPNIIQALTDTCVKLMGFAIIAGAMGSGGLGALAIEKAYAQDQVKVGHLFVLVLVSIVLVQIIQRTGKFIASGAPIYRKK